MSERSTGTTPLATDIGVGPVVMVHEDLLERGLTARQRRDGVVGEGGDQRTDAARDLEAQRVGAAALHLDPRQRPELGSLPGEGDLDRLRGEVAKRLKGP